MNSVETDVWGRVRDRIEEIESRLGLLRAELAHERSAEVKARMQRLNDRFAEVMRELDQYDETSDHARIAKCEFESLIRNNQFIRDHHDS